MVRIYIVSNQGKIEHFPEKVSFKKLKANDEPTKRLYFLYSIPKGIAK